MAAAGEPASRVLAQIAKGRIPAILATRFDPDAGEDLFVRDRLVHETSGALLGEEASVFGKTVFDAPVISLIEILDAAREVSLLAPRRLVLVRGSRLVAGAQAVEDSGTDPEGGAEPEGAGAPSGRDPDAAQIAALARYLESAGSRSCILFVGSPWDGRRKIHKAVLEAATVVDVSRPDPRAMTAWIEGRVREAGGEIEADAVLTLAELRGTDTLRISGEIDKLLLHAGRGQRITREAVLALVGSGEAPSAWVLVDAMADGELDQAIGALRRILDEGEPAPVIVGAIASRLRQMIVLRDEQSGGGRNEAARKVVFPGRSIFFADALARKAARFAPDQLLDALESLYEVDKLSKSSAIDAGAHLERWFLRALSGRAPVRS